MARKTVAMLSEDVANLTEVVTNLVEAIRPTEAAAPAPKRSKSKDIVTAGTSFDYTNGNGVTTRHTVAEVKGRGEGRRAYTDKGQRFKLSTLEKLNGSAVSLV